MGNRHNSRMRSRRVQDMSPAELDAEILKLRQRHWTIREIAALVQMSPNGVHSALKRIAEGRAGQGRDRRG